MPNTADSVDLDLGIRMTLAREGSGGNEQRGTVISGNTIFNFQSTGIEIREQPNDTNAYQNIFTQNTNNFPFNFCRKSHRTNAKN